MGFESYLGRALCKTRLIFPCLNGHSISNLTKVRKGWTILFLRGGGGVGQLPKKNSCTPKEEKEKSCTVSQGEKN